MKSNHFLF